jgi:hypothetical protein
MNIHLTIESETVPGELFDHPVAQELAGMLPLTLRFEDFNGVEKVATLRQGLTPRDVPDADAPAPGEIGYYAPTRGLVLYYGQVGRWPGLVRMGRFSYPLEALRALPDGFTATLAAAQR